MVEAPLTWTPAQQEPACATFVAVLMMPRCLTSSWRGTTAARSRKVPFSCSSPTALRAKPALLPSLDHSWQTQAVLRARSLAAFAPHVLLQLRGYYTAYRRFRFIAAFSWIQPRRRVLCLGETWSLPTATPAASCS